MGFSDKVYGDIWSRRIGVCHPRVIYMQVERNIFPWYIYWKWTSIIKDRCMTE